MSRVLLVDDSPHAQRMGERILIEEGYEVVTVSNADSALIRFEDVDPDLVLADTVMPGRTGYDICQYVKMSPRHRHVRVVLTAGVLEPLDEEQVKRVQADGTLQKPFEASVLLATVRPLAERAAQDRAKGGGANDAPKAAPAGKTGAAPFAAVVDSEQVRAAVTVALDAAMETMVDEITARVVAALQPRKPSSSPAVGASDSAPASPLAKPSSGTTTAPPLVLPASVTTSAPVVTPAVLSPALKPAAVAPPVAPATPAATPTPRLDTVRRVNTLRSRPGSILGLDLSYVEPEVPAAAPPSSALEPLFPNTRPAADPDPAPGARNGPSSPDKK